MMRCDPAPPYRQTLLLCRCLAFTLIEAVVVVSMLAMIGALLLTNLNITTQLSHAHNIAKDVIEIDSRARLIARRCVRQPNSDAKLILKTDQSKLQVMWDAADQGDIKSISHPLQRHSKSEIALKIYTQDGVYIPTDVIAYDTQGRSADYIVDIQYEAIRLSVHIAGLTGWSWIEEVSM